MTDHADWLDSKRLIGLNCFGDRAGALLEVAGTAPTLDSRIERWSRHVETLASRLGWPAPEPTSSRHDGGAMLTAVAPEDRLFAATEALEAAWVAAATRDADVAESEVTRIRALAEEEEDPGGLELVLEARSRGLPAFVDECGTQLGIGTRGRHFPPRAAPEPSEEIFAGVGRVPVALVTGTNGKTTTTRLLAAMAGASGESCGLASTDGAWIGDEVLDSGDVAGPGGARRVLREPRITMAVLETARGGILRRGLAISEAEVAVVTNIGADHLGDGGVNDLERLADVKFLITRALGHTGTAVLNADDPLLVARGRALPCPVHWFSLEGQDRVDRLSSGSVGWLAHGRLHVRDPDGTVHDIGRAEEHPITLGGRARYNIANALAAALAARALGIGVDAIREALARFGAEASDNAGRGTLVDVAGVRVLVDFGHNPAGVGAVLGMFPRTDRGHLHVVLGQAGDRTNEAIQGLVDAAVDAGADRFVIKEMAEYRRGREPGEIPSLIRARLHERGIRHEHITQVETEVEAATTALSNAAPGDVVAAFVHSEYDEVVAALGGIEQA